MAEEITLDPAAVASARTSLVLTSWVAAAGPDWGQAEIDAFVADQAVGSSPVDYRLPNRQIKIPLNLRDVGATSFSSIRLSVQQKVGLFQREGGWIMRQVDSTPLYADVVNATLHLGGSLFAAFRGFDVDAVLSIECLPDWYGDEVTLDTLTGTGLITSKLKASAVDAVVAGNYPGRCRIIVTDTSGHDQHGLLWGMRSRHADTSSTAALFYEAEALTPLNGAATHADVSASGGSSLQHTSLPAASWVAVMSTNLLSGNAPLTHAGSYRVWLRASALPSTGLRLLWGSGSLSVPVTNDTVATPTGTGFYVLDLGTVQLQIPPVGTSQWFGALQAMVQTAGDPVELDCIYLQPLDETAGRLEYVNVPPATSIQTTSLPATAADDAGVGTVAWSNPNNAKVQDFAEAIATLSAVSRTHWLKLTNFGFSIPSGATILGIQATYREGASTSIVSGSPSATSVVHVRLVRAGTVEPTDKTGFTNVEVDSGTFDWTTGGPTDLWSGAWTPTDINSAGFGWVISHEVTAMSGGVLQFSWGVDSVTLTVYYALASGFVIAQDAVVYSNQSTELRTDGMFRANASGVYGNAYNIGDNPRIPPSGMEGRAVELLVKPSRGDFGPLADSGLDSLSAQVVYRPSFLFVGS